MIAAAAGAELRPRASAGLIYSDNVFLAPAGQETSDLIGLIQPGITVTSAGQRYDFSLDYTLQAVYYQDESDANATFSIGRTLLSAQVIPERFIVSGLASISQTVVDPRQQVPLNNLPITGNLQDQTEVRVTPEWRQDLFGNDLRLSYSVGRLSFDEDDLQDVDYQEFNNSLTSPQRDRGVTWALRHYYGAYDYEFVVIKRQSVDLALYSELGAGWAPFVSVGVESDFASPTDSTLDYFTWAVGVRRNTERTRTELAYGERSFGSNVRVLVERRFGAGLTDYVQASYSETPVTPDNFRAVSVPGGPPTIPGDPLLPPGPVPPVDPGLPSGQPPVLLPPGVGQSFLTRQGRVVLSNELVRSTLVMTIFTQDAKAVPFGTDPDAVTRRDSQYGVVGSYDYRFGSRLTLRAYLRLADREFEDGGVVTGADTLLNARLGLDYRLGEKTRLSAWVGTDRQQNAQGLSTAIEYEQNVVGVLLARDFF